MRTIQKGQEPRSLAQHRAVPGATFDGLPTATKNDLRAALLSEQRHLCCYCMGRIRDDEKTKIEHWAPRNKHPELDYQNLLGVCGGNPGPPSKQHCDTRKGQRQIRLDPRAPSPHPALLRYGADGSIAIDDADLQEEIDDVLNLNLDMLKANRKAALDAFLTALRGAQGASRSWSPSALARASRQLEEVDRAGALTPYVEVLRYWLRKRLG